MSKDIIQKRNSLGYVRVSDKKQVEEGQSLEAQEKICRRFAEENDYHILELFIDRAKRGGNPNRLKPLVDRCKQDPSIEAIIVQDIDRFARDTFLHLLFLKEFTAMGVAVKFINQPGVDDSLEGRYMGTIQAATAEYLAKQTGRKAKATMLEKAKMGWYPSWAPIGYINGENPEPTSQTDRRIILIDKDKAPIIKDLFKRYATGNHSYIALSERLKGIGFKTRSGRHLASGEIGRILTDSFYYGWLKWDSVERVGLHEPITDKPTFERCQQVAARNRNFACRKRKHDFLLRGFVFCEECGQRYVAEVHNLRSGNKISYYHCNKRTGCKQPVVEVSILENQVGELFKEFQFSEEFIDAVVKKAREALQSSRNSAESVKRGFYNQMRALETKRNKLENLIVEGVIDRDAYQRQHSEIQEQINAVKGEVDRADKTQGLDVRVLEDALALTRNVPEAYKDAGKRKNTELQRHYLRFFFEKILVKDKEIVDFKPSPMFEALKEQEALILRTNWLPGKDSNLRPSA